MKSRPSKIIVVLLIAALAHELHAQQTRPTTASTTTLAVTGDVPHSLKLTKADLAGMAHRELKVKDRRGQDVTYAGVALEEVLAKAGVSMNARQMRAEFLGMILVARGADGYRVTFSLAELSETLSGHVVLLADQRDGKPLDASEGPFRVIAGGDSLPARWVRQTVELDVKKP